jgi:GNAT superfamily N-acetyltransferase
MWHDMGTVDPKMLDKGDTAYRPWVRSQIARGKVIAWVVETPEGDIAGSGCLWLRPAQPRPHTTGLVDPYLFSMFTQPRFRRKGVASAIMKEVIKWCERDGYGRIWLNASGKGRHLYRKRGFTRTWEMRLELSKTKARSKR